LEKAWNAFRFAGTAKKKQNEVKVFLIGEAVECEGLTDSTFNVDELLKKFVNEGGELLVCASSLKSRNMSGSQTHPISSMVELLDLVIWADKTITF